MLGSSRGKKTGPSCLTDVGQKVKKRARTGIGQRSADGSVSAWQGASAGAEPGDHHRQPETDRFSASPQPSPRSDGSMAHPSHILPAPCFRLKGMMRASYP
jgi:hypothetical protein